MGSKNKKSSKVDQDRSVPSDEELRNLGKVLFSVRPEKEGRRESDPHPTLRRSSIPSHSGRRGDGVSFGSLRSSGSLV